MKTWLNPRSSSVALEATLYPVEIDDEEIAGAYGWDYYQQRRQPRPWLRKLLIIRRQRRLIEHELAKAGTVRSDDTQSLDDAFGGEE